MDSSLLQIIKKLEKRAHQLGLRICTLTFEPVYEFAYDQKKVEKSLQGNEASRAYEGFYKKILKPSSSPDATKELFDNIVGDEELLEEYKKLREATSASALNGWLASKLKADLKLKSGRRIYLNDHLLIKSYQTLI